MNRLFDKIDNSQLTLLRIFYGIILFFECAGAIAVGWVREVYDVPNFTFNFIGFDFLQPPNLTTMYLVYGFMAVLGLLMAFGYRYRTTATLMALLWTLTYLSHKVHYNNHHYLMMLLNWMMVFVPANRYRSLDVKQNRVEERQWCYQWHTWIFIALLGIAYTYAAVAKMNPDWIRAIPLKSWLAYKSDIPVIGPIYKTKFLPYLMAWGGLLFDLLVIPMLLWKRTRMVAFVLSLIFHLSNSMTFQIGTFPYTMIAASVLFFPTEKMQRMFFKRKPFFEKQPAKSLEGGQRRVAWAVMTFLIIQTLLPLRHHLIEGNVFWTEEGHRLSWRMMLRAKQGTMSVKIVEGENLTYRDLREDLSKHQLRIVRVKPDAMWQYVQFLKKQYSPDAEIYIDSRVRLNDHPFNAFIVPGYDMAKAEWNYFGHCDWITDFKGWNQTIK